MKELAAFILLIVLAVIGWNQPYKAHFNSMMGNPPPAPPVAVVVPPPVPAATPAVVQTAPPATPARDNSWLWNKTSMDQPHSGSGDKGGGKNGR
jgi:hypothetical protein